MRNTFLRIYTGPEDDEIVSESAEPVPIVKIPLGELVHVLADAVRTNRRWLEDFQDDTVTISEDLYEVLLAYRHLRSAAGER